MKNVLAVFGALFIFIWVGLVFFGDSMSEDKAVQNNIAIIQAADSSTDPTIQAQGDVARAELELIQNKKMAEIADIKAKQEAKANPVPPAELSPLARLVLKIGTYTIAAGFFLLILVYANRSLKTH